MGRIARVAAQIAQIQQDNLLDVHDWVEHDRIRLMEMEWVDGFDLSRLLTRKMLDWLYHGVSTKRLNKIDDVVVTAGDGQPQPRLKPGIAIAIIRDCLAALAALHRESVIHGDVKPSNIMLSGHRNGEDRGHGLGLPPERRPAAADMHPGLRGPGSPAERRKLAAVRPGQPGLRVDRDAFRRPAVPGVYEPPRAAGGQAVFGPAAPQTACRTR